MPRAFCLMLPAIVCGCSHPPAAPPQESGYAVTSNDGTYQLVFSPEPQAIPLNEMFSLDIHVYDGADRRPVSGDVRLDVDAGMPEHRHGMTTRPRVTPTGGGAFTADGLLFHMPGFWEIYFDITREGVTERVQVPVDLE